MCRAWTAGFVTLNDVGAEVTVCKRCEPRFFKLQYQLQSLPSLLVASESLSLSLLAAAHPAVAVGLLELLPLAQQHAAAAVVPVPVLSPILTQQQRQQQQLPSSSHATASGSNGGRVPLAHTCPSAELGTACAAAHAAATATSSGRGSASDTPKSSSSSRAPQLGGHGAVVKPRGAARAGHALPVDLLAHNLTMQLRPGTLSDTAGRPGGGCRGLPAAAAAAAAASPFDCATAVAVVARTSPEPKKQHGAQRTPERALRAQALWHRQFVGGLHVTPGPGEPPAWMSDERAMCGLHNSVPEGGSIAWGDFVAKRALEFGGAAHADADGGGCLLRGSASADAALECSHMHLG
ncbi:hypothetical protein FOA52_010434 [Chlamydomonas sp. UWO 241]|nr:hypothetical protein FOA52_010434 [Chlamydomonas sp. UWO 241]